MTSDKLPAILTFQGKQASISIERALKQIQRILEQLLPVVEDDPPEADAVRASLDDVELMLGAIER